MAAVAAVISDARDGGAAAGAEIETTAAITDKAA
jgi:hypothetical protein